jgi:hypothetical protein
MERDRGFDLRLGFGAASGLPQSEAEMQSRRSLGDAVVRELCIKQRVPGRVDRTVRIAQRRE